MRLPAKMLTLCLAVTAASVIAPAPAESPTVMPPKAPVYIPPPYVKAQQLFFDDQLPQLDPLVESLVRNDTRDEDGEPALMLVTRFLGHAAVPRDGDVETGRQRIQAWLEADPKSAFAPVLESIRLREMGWRARGTGFSSEVAEEGWQIFREQNQAAWKILMDHRAQSSGIPSWYELAIAAGRDANLPEEGIRDVFDEGKKRFPSYYAIYFNYLRDFAPRWGGDYAAAKAFIVQQSDSKSNREGDVLYARLFWSLDSVEGSPASFFETSGVDWRRMRHGLEMMQTQYPQSRKIVTEFGAFACRARDEASYRRLRPQLTNDEFREYISNSFTLDVCDRRFPPRTADK